MGAGVESTRTLSLRQSNGRISNAVADLLRRKLTVPEIYLKPRISGLQGVDVIAVDHSGSGDVHGAEILYGKTAFTNDDVATLLERVKKIPLHFRYVALPHDAANEERLLKAFRGPRGFDPSGIGRVGLLGYSPNLLNGASATDGDAVTLIVKPERFLLRGEKRALLEKFLSKAKPDMAIRI